MDRVIGQNTHGNRNEDELVLALNDHTFSTLNNNLKEFIRYIAKDKNIQINNDTKIKASKEKNNKLKQDIYLYIETDKNYISLKIGKGNSVHQEKCEDFVKYIKEELNASDEICDDFRLFLWADGTLNGSGALDKDSDGNIICRFSSREFKEKYPSKYDTLQKFLNEHVSELIKRFLFIGRHNSRVDYIYHGNANNGFWVSSEKIISFNLNEHFKKNDSLHVGKMTLQSWNISRRGNTENKRGQLQVKYSQMQKDFFNLMKENCSNIGTFLGDKEEFDISSRFNRNKNLPLWSELVKNLDSLDDIYMVRVSNRVLSHLSNRKVYPKADAYLIRCKLDRNFLLEREFSLTEREIENIAFEKIPSSGISVKMTNSKSYTIQKLTLNSFREIFSSLIDEVEYVFFGILLYCNDLEKIKNFNMLDILKLEVDKVEKYYTHNIGKTLDLDDVNDLKLISKWSKSKIKNLIVNNYEIYKAIFTGEKWFDEPYVAHYLYTNKKITKNIPTDFYITTGSGRSKGKLSIEIKPA